MQIAPNTVVYIHYKLTDDQGELLDSSEGQEPLAYIHGMGNIIRGLEAALTGRKTGDVLSVRVEPEDGYGERDPDLLQVVPVSAFEGVDEVVAGMRFHAEAQDGSVQEVTVVDVSDGDVTLDGNHPMAGVVLNFEVHVTDVREATPEELDHGHVHGAGGHHH
ncbi:MAG: peptidyl-prolyl cis-trans isomerase, FKBP-type [Pseudomonadota bacterium]|jgi:FKBP-type peptidyl-prolyl cis-trans isomerase SlyD